MGPLYVTHKTQGRPRRYDSIWGSPEFEVLDAGHIYDGKNTHGSDHGIVWCDLRLRH